MKKRAAIFFLCLVLALMICACAEIPPASSEPNDPSATPEPTPTVAVSATPEATPTPVPTKKPAAKPTATPTTRPTPTAKPQSSVPEYLMTYAFRSVDALREFIETEDVKTFQKGHYESMVSTIKACGYFMKPVFTEEIPFTTLSGAQIAFAVSKSEKRGSGVGYRVSYKNIDAVVYIHDILQSMQSTVKENLYAFELAADTRTDGFNETAAIKAGYKQTTLTAGNTTRDAWGRDIGNSERDGYRIWFMLDDGHLVSVNWFSDDVALAEEFVSKLEFEKVELKTGKPTLPTTPITPEAGITPIVTPPVGEIVPNA